MMQAQQLPESSRAPAPVQNFATVSSQAAVRRYRKQRRRIDCYPSVDALAAIEATAAAGLSNCLAGVIDALILEGRRARISGNAPGQGQAGK